MRIKTSPSSAPLINEGNEQSVLCSIVLMEKVYIVKKHIGRVLSTMLMRFPSMNS